MGMYSIHCIPIGMLNCGKQTLIDNKPVINWLALTGSVTQHKLIEMIKDSKLFTLNSYILSQVDFNFQTRKSSSRSSSKMIFY